MISDVSRSTSARAKRISGSADKPETETKNNKELIGQNSLGQDKDSVITIWGSYNRDQDKPEPEVHEERDHVTQSVSLTLPCVEEVSLCYFFECFYDENKAR